MDKKTFDAVDPIVNEIADAISEILASSESEKLRGLLTKLNKTLGSQYMTELMITLDVSDEEQDRCLPVLQTGMSGFDSGEPYQTWGDSSPQKYVVDGEMLIVPHDRCPKCWDVWDFKFENRSCSHCGATLGRDVKVLLDTDVCPNCEEGKVSMSRPTCAKCGYHVDLDAVVWG